MLTKVGPLSLSKVANIRLSKMSMPVPHDSLISTGAASERHRRGAPPYRLIHVCVDPVSRQLARANSGSGFGEHRRVSFGERRGLDLDITQSYLKYII